jgi:hypothetical protein
VLAYARRIITTGRRGSRGPVKCLQLRPKRRRLIPLREMGKRKRPMPERAVFSRDCSVRYIDKALQVSGDSREITLWRYEL